MLVMANFNYTLRMATDTDYDFLYDLHVATIKPYVAATWGWDDTLQQAMFQERWNPVDTQVVVVDGTDAGTFQWQAW